MNMDNKSHCGGMDMKDNDYADQINTTWRQAGEHYREAERMLRTAKASLSSEDYQRLLVELRINATPDVHRTRTGRMK